MKEIIRTNSSNPDFVVLVKQLDAELAIRDGDDHAFYDQFNKIDAIKYVLVAYDETKPVGCGAIKEMPDGKMEVKRMYVPVEERGKGIASKIVRELESWAKELGVATCVLETGDKQPEAIALYKKLGYDIIENYGQYAGVATSICFEKHV